MRFITHITLLALLLAYSTGLPIVSHYCSHADRLDIGLWTAGEECTHHGESHAHDAQAHLPACCRKHVDHETVHHSEDDCCDTDGTFFKLPDHEHSSIAKLTAPSPLFAGWFNTNELADCRYILAANHSRGPPDYQPPIPTLNDRLARLDTWLL